ncbi:MAG: glycosyltransferase family 39 protein [Candidatus Woesearchaeota archaeon]
MTETENIAVITNSIITEGANTATSKPKHDYVKNVKDWVKNPYNLAFIIVLGYIIYIRFRYLFQESIWVDETAYYLAALYFMKTWSFGPFTPFMDLRVMPEIVIMFWGLFFNLFVAGRLMALTYAVLGIIYTYLIGKEIKNEALGFVAAVLVAFNPQIWFHSSRTLIDSPLTTMFVICAYYLIRLEKEYSTKNVIYLVIALLLAVQTKYLGILAIAIVAGHYILKIILFEKNKKELIKQLIHSKSMWVILIFLSIAAYIVSQRLRLSNLQYNDFFINNISLVVDEPIKWLALLGLVFAAIYLKKEYIIIALWAVIYYFAFTVHPAYNDPRYVLPAIPALIILSMIGLFELFELIAHSITLDKKYLNYLLIILIAVLIVPTYYEEGNSMIFRMSYAFTGYDEAGKWIAYNVPDGAIVYTMSTSWANLYSENVPERITIGNTAQFKTIGDLNEYLINVTSPFYLVIDQWESGAQPNWQPNQEMVNNLIKKGFTLEKIITKKYPVSQDEFNAVYNQIGLFDININDQKFTEIPAIFIFKLNK